MTLGLNWWWNTNARLQFNCSLGTIPGRGVEIDSTVYSRGDYQVAGIRMKVEF